jgi:uncharacterized protein (TIGR03435 family)
MMKTAAVLSACLITASVLAAQDPRAPTQPDILLSIKANTGPNQGMSITNRPGGVMVMVNGTITSIFSSAYPSPVRQIVNAPEWLSTERYDVTARVEGNPTREERLELWRRAFAERMKLSAHYEQRETPTYALVLARPDGRLGPNLRRTVDCAALAAEGRARGAAPPPPAGTGTPIGDCWGGKFGMGRIESGGTLISVLVQSLSGALGRVTFDKTGLEGYYAFTLDYAPARLDGASDVRPDIFTALREQLGLKVEPTTSMLEHVVIDHIERPTPD